MDDTIYLSIETNTPFKGELIEDVTGIFFIYVLCLPAKHYEKWDIPTKHTLTLSATCR
jgi:hypothetical protein